MKGFPRFFGQQKRASKRAYSDGIITQRKAAITHNEIIESIANALVYFIV